MGNDADVRVDEDALPATIPDDEEVVAGLDGPAETCVSADVLGFGVVLNEAGENEIGIPGVSGADGPQALNEICVGKMGEVVFGVEVELDFAARRGPANVVFPLC